MWIWRRCSDGGTSRPHSCSMPMRRFGPHGKEDHDVRCSRPESRDEPRMAQAVLIAQRGGVGNLPVSVCVRIWPHGLILRSGLGQPGAKRSDLSQLML